MSNASYGYLQLSNNSTCKIYGDGPSGRIGINESAPAAMLQISDPDTCLTLNRNGSDGWLQSFRRGGGTVGVISVAAGVITYGTFSGFHYGWLESDARPSDEGFIER